MHCPAILPPMDVVTKTHDAVQTNLLIFFVPPAAPLRFPP